MPEALSSYAHPSTFPTSSFGFGDARAAAPEVFETVADTKSIGQPILPMRERVLETCADADEALEL
jgi:hypothetical protein